MLNWRRGIYGGALIGGIFWGIVALVTIGAPGDQAQHSAIDGVRLLIAAAVSVTLILIGVLTMWRSHAAVVRTIGLALALGTPSGWLIVASLALQNIGWS